MEVSGRFRTVAMFFSHDCEFNCELRKEFLANLLLRALELLVEKFSPAGWPWCLKNVKGIHIWKHCKKCENALSPGSLSRAVLVRHVKVWSKFWRLHVDKVICGSLWAREWPNVLFVFYVILCFSKKFPLFLYQCHCPCFVCFCVFVYLSSIAVFTLLVLPSLCFLCFCVFFFFPQ